MTHYAEERYWRRDGEVGIYDGPVLYHAQGTMEITSSHSHIDSVDVESYGRQIRLTMIAERHYEVGESLRVYFPNQYKIDEDGYYIYLGGGQYRDAFGVGEESQPVVDDVEDDEWHLRLWGWIYARPRLP